MRFVSWVLCLLLLCCAPTIAATLGLRIEGIEGKVLDNVELRLKELSQLKPLSEFTPDELRYQINNALKPFGYLKANIVLQKDFIRIETGPQLILSALKVELIGEGRHNPQLLGVVLPLKLGAPLLTEDYNQAKLLLINKAESLGYLRADFKKAEIVIDEANNTAQIQLIFNTNALYYFGQVRFDPTTITPELLHRYRPFNPGQVYSTEKILAFNKGLSDSGYFSSVLVKPKITQAPTVPIEVHTEPVPYLSYFLGAGYGTDTGPRGRAGLNVIPVNRAGDQFTIQALGSFIQNSLQARYLIPGVNPITDQYSVMGNFSSLNFDTGYSNASQLSVAQNHRLERFQRTLSLNGLYEGFHYTNEPNVYQFLLYPKATFTFNYTENKLFSPSGYQLSFNAQGSSKKAFSQLDMAQFWVDAKAAYWIETLRLRLFGHTIQGYTAIQNINQLPLSLALLLGGTDNLKAYSFNSIPPGKVVSYGGFELQKETLKNWYVVGFYDAGTVYNPSQKQVQQDVGGALMWVSPIGPIKVGLAQAMDTNGLRLFISMGPDL